MELYFSLSAYGGVPTRKALTVFWEAGIRQVELAIGPKPDKDAVQAIQDFEQQGMVYRAHHAFIWGGCHHPFNLAQPLDWNYFQRLTNFLAGVKIAAYSVHGGNFATLSKRSLAYATFLENVHRLDRLCQMRGIVLGVETMYPTSPNHATQNLLDNAEEVTQFCQDAPEIKLVIDLAHLNIWQNHSLKAKLQWLQLTPERLLEIHISDNDGLHDTHSRITPQTWWIPHIAQFPVGVPIVLESRLNRLSVAGVKQECEQIQQLLQMN